MEYVRVAKCLQKLITSLYRGEYINNEVAKDLAIRLTLHLEDTVAEAGVWRGFCTESINACLENKCLSNGENGRYHWMR